MKKMVTFGLLAAAVVLAGGVPAARAADAVIDLPFLSAYLWRGMNFNDEPVFQPAATISSSAGFMVKTWGNLNLSDNIGEDTAGKFSEIDVMASYTRALGPVSVSLGLTEYRFSNITKYDWPGTREVFVGVGLTNMLIRPTLTFNYDYDEVDGWCGSFGLGYVCRNIERLTVTADLWIGVANGDYNTFYWAVSRDNFEDVNKTALNDANARLGAAYKLCDNWSVAGYVQYTTLLDSDIKDGAERRTDGGALFNEDGMFVGSLGLSCAF